MKEWNFKIIYANEEELQKDIALIKEEMDKITSFEGRLNTKEVIEEYFIYMAELSKRIEKCVGYIYNTYSLDARDLNSQMNMGKIQNMFMNFSAKAAFVDNELLKTSYETYCEYAKNSTHIKNNLFQLKKLFDAKDHVLLPNEERIIACFSQLNSAFSSLYAMVEDADAIAKKCTLSSGEKLEISKSNYTSLLSSHSLQKDRKKIFNTFFKHYDEQKNTFASIYEGVVNKDIARMSSRGYKSLLATFLEKNRIPDEVYLSLIDTVRSHTSSLQRYMKLRKKVFKLSTYHTYDRFLTFSNVKTSYLYEKAYEDVLKALSVMGEDFLNHAKVALEDGRVDVYSRPGKRSGAYSTGIYGYGPYILLNHNNNLDSAFTLAHECGHSMHTLYSHENNCFENKDYEIFVAEIASTFNEQLFLEFLLKNSSSKELKIQALEKEINNIVSTFYRQTLFADFEYQAHMKALNGEKLTYKVLNSIMEDLYMTYYGIDLNKEELKKYVWAYIPHLYNSPFYVYQYATSFACSMKIYQDIKNGVEGAKEKYFNMLKAGGRDYPLEIVKAAGVDLTSPEPFLAVVKELDHLLDELEELLD